MTAALAREDLLNQYAVHLGVRIDARLREHDQTAVFVCIFAMTRRSLSAKALTRNLVTTASSGRGATES
jgi:hypothetical protein